MARICIGIFRIEGLETEPLLHALENEVDSISIAALHPFQIRPDVIFLPHLFLGPFHRDLAVPGEGFDPVFICGGPSGQNVLRDRVKLQDVAEEMHNVLFACQQRQVSLNDVAVKTVIYNSQQAARQLVESFHRPVPPDLALTTKSSILWPMESNPTVFQDLNSQP
jgi:hypothetical protein